MSNQLKIRGYDFIKFYVGSAKRWVKMLWILMMMTLAGKQLYTQADFRNNYL